MMRIAGILAAFVRRDFLIEVSYRTSFVLQMFGIVFLILMWKFISGVIDPAADTPGLEGADYFGYVVLGLAFFHYLSASMTAFSTKVRNEQMTGTLEAMLVTPTSAGVIVLGSAVWIFLRTSITVVAYLAIGFFLGLGLRPEGLPTGLLVLVLTVLAFSGIGILSVSFVLYLKKADPINLLIANVSAMVGGVFYPPESMYPWVARLSHFLPITHALKAFRRALLQGSGPGAMLPELAALAIFSAVLLPLGILSFRLAVRRARQEGSLVQY
jgi:ABC-2 type transport system permease protein